MSHIAGPETTNRKMSVIPFHYLQYKNHVTLLNVFNNSLNLVVVFKNIWKRKKKWIIICPHYFLIQTTS